MVKTIGYLIFAFTYYICRILPAQSHRVLCIMTHDDGEGSNVRLVVNALKEQGAGYQFRFITKSETTDVKGFSDIKSLLSFFLIKPYYLARSGIILMDNVFLPLAFLKLRKNVKAVQLWHGTGTIKKFGQDVNTGKLKVWELRANRNITHLITNSVETAKLYAKVFGVSTDRVYPIGLPKTDEILRRMKEAKELGRSLEKKEIYRRYGIPEGKKLILYAPTFRDQELSKPEAVKKLQGILQSLPGDYVLGFRLHPFVARMADGMAYASKVYNFSHETDLTSLIMAADLLITDYSSILFEYCITGRPMIFYAYDLEDFSEHGRGFYEDYVSFVPGPVAFTAEEVGRILEKQDFDMKRIRSFVKSNFPYLDGNAVKRLIGLIT